MDFNDLCKNYLLLLGENKRLAEENNRLRARLGITGIGSLEPRDTASIEEEDVSTLESIQDVSLTDINNTSDTTTKIKLFMWLFKGRPDVYAKRWENKKKRTSGYSPVCMNQWQAGLCDKSKIPCAKCLHQAYASLDERVVEEHLRGNLVTGIYPMLPDETCRFLAIDFDETDWQVDISVVRNVCAEFDIPVAVERSRSCNGGHAWFFFENPLSAILARKFGTALVTHSMAKRHEIRFKSYDRMFPNQDTMPKGGLGNLIALPLQKAARTYGNSEFIDENFQAYLDQWAFLASIRKISENRIESLIPELCNAMNWGC